MEETNQKLEDSSASTIKAKSGGKLILKIFLLIIAVLFGITGLFLAIISILGYRNCAEGGCMWSLIEMLLYVLPSIFFLFWSFVAVLFYTMIFKKEKNKLSAEEDRALIKKELLSNKIFYIFTGLLLFQVIYIPFFLLLFSVFIPFSFPAISVSISSISAAIVIVLSFGLIKKALKKTDKPETACWESYAAFMLLGLYWFVFILFAPGSEWQFSQFLPSDFFLVVIFISGLILGLRSLINKEQVNRILGVIILVAFSFSLLFPFFPR